MPLPPHCRLSLEQYLDIGRKRASNFEEGDRRLVYAVWQAFEAVKQNQWRWVFQCLQIVSLLLVAAVGAARHGWAGRGMVGRGEAEAVGMDGCTDG